MEIQKEYQLSFPLLLDENRALSKKYGVRGLPASYFLNKQGKVEQIVQKWLTETQIKEIVAEL
jgi:peroxiredoxin